MHALTTLATALAFLVGKQTFAHPLPIIIDLPEAALAPPTNVDSATVTNGLSMTQIWHPLPEAEKAATSSTHALKETIDAELFHRCLWQGSLDHSHSAAPSKNAMMTTTTNSRIEKANETCLKLLKTEDAAVPTRLAASEVHLVVSEGGQEEEEEEEAWGGATVERRGVEKRVKKLWIWANPWVDLWCTWLPSWCHDESDD